MASHIGVPHIDHQSRPGLHRSRSHSSPSQNPAGPEPSQSTIERPTRPSHGRSHSYLSSIEPKPRSANTIPTPPKALEKTSSRLHIPGKHHLHHDSHRKHRYAQSETEPHHRFRKTADTDSLPNLVAGLSAERQKRAAAAAAGHDGDKHSSPNEFLSAVPGGLTRIMSTRSNRADTSSADGGSSGRYDLRRRATSDPKQPRNPEQRTKSTVEMDLERADRVRRQKKFTMTKADLAKRDKEIEEAEEEMREKLFDVNRAGVEITRRLDYGYYNLLEKVGNLVGTIQSFQSLALQSKQLVVNFEGEAVRLDGDVMGKTDGLRRGFDEREERVRRLEGRGRDVGKKAEELGRRLENARVILENWEKRENRAKKVWFRVWGGVWGTMVAVLVLVLGILVYKEWWFRGDPVKAGLNVPVGGHWNGSLRLGDGGKGEEILKQVDMPEEVRLILKGIEERNRRRKDFATSVSVTDEALIRQDDGDDKLRALDDL